MSKPQIKAKIDGRKVKTEFVQNDGLFGAIGGNPASMLSIAGIGLAGLQFLGNKVRGNPNFNKALPWGIASVGVGIGAKYFLPNKYKILGWMGVVALGGKALLEVTTSPQRGETLED